MVKKMGTSKLPNRMTYESGGSCFHYTVERGVCFLTLADRGYPKKLAYQYLEEIQNRKESMREAAKLAGEAAVKSRNVRRQKAIARKQESKVREQHKTRPSCAGRRRRPARSRCWAGRMACRRVGVSGGG